MSIIHDNDSFTLYLLIVARNLATFTVKPTMQFIHSSLVALHLTLVTLLLSCMSQYSCTTSSTTSSGGGGF